VGRWRASGEKMAVVEGRRGGESPRTSTIGGGRRATMSWRILLTAFFVEDAESPVGEEIHFERFELDAGLFWACIEW